MRARPRIVALLLPVLALASCSTAPDATNPSTSATATVAASASAIVSAVASPTLMPSESASAAPSASASTATADRTLQLADPRLEGDDVRQLQTQLRDLGYTEVGPIDGIFGPQTDRAVRAFQAANGLLTDGIVGPQTRARLASADVVRGTGVTIVVSTSNGWLLGGSQGTAWLDVAAAEPLARADTPYRVFTLDREEDGATGGPASATNIDDICPDLRVVDLVPEPSQQPGVAVSGGGNLQPRPVEQISDELLSDAYVAALQEVLQKNGIAEPELRFKQIARTDLDGDGVPQTIITIERYPDNAPLPTSNAGDYSAIVVLRTIDSYVEVGQVVVEAHPDAIEFGAPNVHQVTAIVDLNNDGRMELVVDSGYYEGSATSVFEINGTTATEVLATGCGV